MSGKVETVKLQKETSVRGLEEHVLANMQERERLVFAHCSAHASNIAGDSVVMAI